MEIKTEKTRRCSLDQEESTFTINRRSTNITCRRSTASAKVGRLFMTVLKPKFYIFTKLPLTDFDIIFMCFAIVLDNTCFLIFVHSQHKVFRVFSSLERRSKTPLKLCIVTLVFLPYFIYAFYSELLCSAFLCLNNSLVRLRVY